MGRLNSRKRQIAQLAYNRKIRVKSQGGQPTRNPLPEEIKSGQRNEETESATESSTELAWTDHIITLDQYHRAQQNLTLKITN